MTTIDTTAGKVAPRELLRGWDSLELWVGNARAFSGWLCAAFGFRVIAYAGPETGRDDTASYVLAQGRVRLVVTAGLDEDSPVVDHVRRHGDGVRDVAFQVSDVDATFASAIARGATPVRPPSSVEDGDGVVRLATIGTYGETQHTFVDTSAYRGIHRPGYTTEGLPPEPAGDPVGIEGIDHVVGNIEKGRLDHWVEFYRSVLGFEEFRSFSADQISTEFSALMSTVVWDGTEIKLPLNEPADGKRKSQIAEYLEAYHGPGVQHIAMATDDIVAAVASLRRRGLRFLEAPASYYDDARARLGHLDLPWDDIERLGILVDEEPDGWLLQIFTEMVTDRPTVFIEVIQRGGASGFGEGNFKALFEAIEREQARRGHL
ncbi:MAG TPA: 4-hydroxyphenylpyruvate dioxygenase [Acidimicrobiales bacterium]|nr:4-hydroxyphenylpyruvate dioxygenase [Acidimicrobiales bacterium]